MEEDPCGRDTHKRRLPRSRIKKISGDLPYETLTEEASAVTPGSDALVVLPYFAGERTPLQDPRARGLISGLTLRHGRGHLYRAMLEATAYGVRHIFETMREAGGVGERLVAVGGGTKGGLWTQIVSDITGRPQDLPEQTRGASYGGALSRPRRLRHRPEQHRRDRRAEGGERGDLRRALPDIP